MEGRSPPSSDKLVTNLNVSLERDMFLRILVRELAGTLEDVVVIEDASGFISVVGQNVGDWLDKEYRGALSVSKLTAFVINIGPIS